MQNPTFDSTRPLSMRLRHELKGLAASLARRMPNTEYSINRMLRRRIITARPLNTLLTGLSPVKISSMVSVTNDLGLSLVFVFSAPRNNDIKRSLVFTNADERVIARQLATFFTQVSKHCDLRALSDRAELSSQTVHNALAGCSTPNVPTVFKLARALGYETYLEIETARPRSECVVRNAG